MLYCVVYMPALPTWSILGSEHCPVHADLKAKCIFGTTSTHDPMQIGPHGWLGRGVSSPFVATVSSDESLDMDCDILDATV